MGQKVIGHKIHEKGQKIMKKSKDREKGHEIMKSIKRSYIDVKGQGRKVKVKVTKKNSQKSIS